MQLGQPQLLLMLQIQLACFLFYFCCAYFRVHSVVDGCWRLYYWYESFDFFPTYSGFAAKPQLLFSL